MQYQVQVPLGGLPVNLVLVGNKEHGAVVFVPIAPISKLILDVGGDVEARFYSEGFDLYVDPYNPEEFNYETVYDYKNIPLMLQWLQQQNLQEPKTIFG